MKSGTWLLTRQEVSVVRIMKADKYKLCLYIAGKTQKAERAIANLKRICETQLAGKYALEVIDLLEHPGLAAGE